MQRSNVIIMPNRAPNPESVPALRNEIQKLTNDFKKFREDYKVASESASWRKQLDKLSKVEASLLSALVIAVFGVIAWAAQGLTNSYVDGRIGDKLTPINASLQKINDRTVRMDGELSVLQSEVAVIRYSSFAPIELKKHRDELGAIKSGLASSPRNVPGFWAASFQIINLLSTATSYIENPTATHSTVEDSSSLHVVKNGDILLLRGTIANSLFEDSVIQFDPNVRLINVTFKKCVFILPLENAAPPKNLQQIGNQLLTAGDISNVSLTAS